MFHDDVPYLHLGCRAPKMVGGRTSRVFGSFAGSGSRETCSKSPFLSKATHLRTLQTIYRSGKRAAQKTI